MQAFLRPGWASAGPRPARRLIAALMGGLGLHLLLLTGLATLPWSPRPPSIVDGPALQWVWLPEPAPARAPPPDDDADRATAAPDARLRRPALPPERLRPQASRPDGGALRAPEAAALPAETAGPQAIIASDAPEGAPSADSAAQPGAATAEPGAALDLRLRRLGRPGPPGGSAAPPSVHELLGDRRVPPTLEKRLDLALGGSGPWTEEIIDADHRRLRRGNTCVRVQRSRLAQIDPFSAAARSAPWQVGQPTRCD